MGFIVPVSQNWYLTVTDLSISTKFLRYGLRRVPHMLTAHCYTSYSENRVMLHAIHVS